MKKFIIVAMALIICLSMVGCTKTGGELTTIKFGISKSQSYALLMIADKEGYFKDENLNVELDYLSTANVALDGLLGGSSDMAIVNDAIIANLGYSGNKDISYIASITKGVSNGIIARKSAGINSPADLKGKKIAYPPGTSAEIFIRRFLAKYNIDLNDVELVSLQPNAITPAMISKDVDAASIWEPFIYNTGKGLGDDQIVFRDDDVYTGYGLIAVNNTFAGNNSKAIISFLSALKKAEDFANSNKDEAENIVAEALNMDVETVRATWDLQKFQLFLDEDIKSAIEKDGEEDNTIGNHQGEPLPDYSIYYNDKYIQKVK